MKPTSASSENHFTHGCTLRAKAGKRCRMNRPRANGTPMMSRMSPSITQGLSSTATSSSLAVGCSEPQKATESGSTKM